MLLESIAGSLLGGLLRLAPEVLKFFDKKDERKHELAMLDKQTDYARVAGEFRVEEKYVDYGTAQLDAMAEAYKEQAVAVGKASKWVANLNALVRPMITYIIFGLYVAFKISMIVAGLMTGQPWLVVFGTWTEADMAMLNAIIGFHFINRSIEKYRK